MWNPNLSNNEQTIDQINDWHDEVSISLRDRFRSIVNQHQNTSALPNKFLFMTIEEIKQYFDTLQDEVNYAASLSIIASFEASISVDLANRIRKKSKNGISKDLKQISNNNQKRPRLEDVLTIWKKYCCASQIANFQAAYAFRNWLAHGRYWHPKLGRNTFQFSLLYLFLENLKSCMESYTKMSWK